MKFKEVEQVKKQKICEFDDCDKQQYQLQYCSSHYGQHYRGEKLRKLRRSRHTPRPQCKFDKCDKLSLSLGYCSGHYQQFKKHGKVMPIVNTDFRKSLNRRIDKTSSPDSCWLWTGGTNDRGYGKFKRVIRGKEKTITIHRYMYEKYIDPLGKNMTIDHLCRVRNCCNPNHLQLVSQRENAKNMLAYKTLKAEIDYLKSRLQYEKYFSDGGGI